MTNRANQEWVFSISFERSRQSFHFDWVADWSTGTMGLDIIGAAKSEACLGVRLAYHGFLSSCAWQRNSRRLSIATRNSELADADQWREFCTKPADVSQSPIKSKRHSSHSLAMRLKAESRKARGNAK